MTTDTSTLCSGGRLLAHRSASSVPKRLFDIAGSLVGLLLLATIFIPVAIAICLDSPGPVLYRQIRCGLKGNCFVIYKFRSMFVDADERKHLIVNESIGHMFKNTNDPRVTRIGRFLRKTSLDEFPQFWNVLKGEMSLVGTRPPTLDEVQHYSDRHWLRLSVKPGLTGEWQVCGRSDIKDFESVVDLDLRYQALWTAWYDCELILRTLWILIFKRSGSY
ncbi:MAG: sugar transferase [Cyanobacteria bacterium J06588_5]